MARDTAELTPSAPMTMRLRYSTVLPRRSAVTVAWSEPISTSLTNASSWKSRAAIDGVLQQDVVEPAAVQEDGEVGIDGVGGIAAGQHLLAVDDDVGALDAAFGVGEHLVRATQAVEPIDALGGKPVAADLVAGEGRLVEHQHLGALAREEGRGARSAGPCPHHDDVVERAHLYAAHLKAERTTRMTGIEEVLVRVRPRRRRDRHRAGSSRGTTPFRTELLEIDRRDGLLSRLDGEGRGVDRRLLELASEALHLELDLPDIGHGVVVDREGDPRPRRPA